MDATRHDPSARGQRSDLAISIPSGPVTTHTNFNWVMERLGVDQS